MIEIKLFKEQALKGYTLIEGFPGAGLVGPMASSYIIEKLGMEYIGKIESEQFPPIAVIACWRVILFQGIKGYAGHISRKKQHSTELNLFRQLRKRKTSRIESALPLLS